MIVGKTATSEFGYRGYTKSLIHGNTHNPWNVGLTPGGSSGGAVASVAAGVTPIALGTDGGGSIRSPCAFTGLTGIKANFGRVPVWPASATPTLAHVGPIARDTRDCEILLRVISGSDRRDAFSLLPPLARTRNGNLLDGLRVAYSPDLGYAQVDEAVAKPVGDAVARLREIFPGLEQVQTVCADPAEILAAEFIGGCNARLGDVVNTSPELVDPPLLDAIRQFRSDMTSDNYTRLLQRRMEHRERMHDFFDKFDVLLTPTTPCVAWDINQGIASGFESATVWSYFTYPFNLSGQPAATLPCGFSECGLPVGLQIVVPLLREDILCSVMARCEAALAKSHIPIDPRDAKGHSLLTQQ
ncbi:MAG: amidase family protein [Hyphomicrobiales bacterium]